MSEDAVAGVEPREMGRRLREARRARGLTQEESAANLNIARTTIVAIEQGQRRVQNNEVFQLAELYGRPLSDFVGSRRDVGDFSVQFRARVAKESGEHAEKLRNSIYSFQRLCEDYLLLEDLNCVSRNPKFLPEYDMDGIAPEDAAAAERSRLGLGSGPILNLREILEDDAGMRVFYTPFPSDIAGVFAFTQELGGCIGVNIHHPEVQRRWSLAHEYGHFLTNRYKPDVTHLTIQDRVSGAERFADAFASALLLPTTGVRMKFHEMARAVGGRVTPAEVCRLAHSFFVSVEAMMRRLEELKLLRKGTWNRLRDRGFKVQEAQTQMELSIPVHHDQVVPLRFRYLAVQAYVNEQLSEGRLATLLRVDRISARDLVRELTHPVHLQKGGKVASLKLDFAHSLNQVAS